MVNTCFSCKWRNGKFPRRSFHSKCNRFPLKQELRQKWLDILGKSNISIGKHTTLCSIHFEEDCFRYGLIYGTRILKDGSLPTRHLTKIKTENQVLDSSQEIKPPESMMENNLNMHLPIIDNVKTELNIADNWMKSSTSDLDISTSHTQVKIECSTFDESSTKSLIDEQLDIKKEEEY
ncbi:THAP domain-containing protein 2-like isoform X2 [Coccinella septempunctata]|uniref:THAP domain-containing protein 2-like isoform X2 n=1 Tax=Coccinella septempunctata TaxID=41139 RepID=UPI001D09771B|nr:THAP domain-containing protein 2-like isoform X2 [Coccinella septempunctata]